MVLGLTVPVDVTRSAILGRWHGIGIQLRRILRVIRSPHVRGLLRQRSRYKEVGRLKHNLRPISRELIPPE